MRTWRVSTSAASRASPGARSARAAHTATLSSASATTLAPSITEPSTRNRPTSSLTSSQRGARAVGRAETAYTARTSWVLTTERLHILPYASERQRPVSTVRGLEDICGQPRGMS